MIKVTDKKKCTGCSSCFNSCPVDCISMTLDNEGFYYPSVDEEKCIHCNKCEMVCPILNHNEKDSDLKVCFAAKNKNEKQRWQSSSGGIFFALSTNVLQNGGAVCGVALDDNCLAVHYLIFRMDELLPLVGSKYMQSDVKKIFVECKRVLDRGQELLFCGTTCQIGGLKSYLMKDYPNLITMDFICLGVPSPQIWKDYLDTFFKDKIYSVNFKDKSKGWHHFSLRIKHSNGEFCQIGAKTYFFNGFFKGLYSRPSCSECVFKSDLNRISDITVSDCWGAEHIAPELDDDKGLSSVICHSEKGLSLFELIKDQLDYKETNIEDVKKYNSGYYMSKEMAKQRTEFWNDYNKIDKERLFRKYCATNNPGIIRRAINKVIRIIRDKQMFTSNLFSRKWYRYNKDEFKEMIEYDYKFNAAFRGTNG